MSRALKELSKDVVIDQSHAHDPERVHMVMVMMRYVHMSPDKGWTRRRPKEARKEIAP